MTNVIGRRLATNRPDPGRIGRYWSAVRLMPVSSFYQGLCSLLVGLVGLVAGRRSIGRSPLLYRGDQSTNGDQWPSERGFDGTAVASPLHPTEIRNGLQGIAKGQSRHQGKRGEMSAPPNPGSIEAFERDIAAKRPRRPRKLTRPLAAALLLAGCATTTPTMATPPSGTTTTTEVEAARPGEQLLSAAGQPLHTLRCGTERWSVKIGIDREVGHVHTDTPPQPATVAVLADQPAPAVLPPGDRVEPAEDNVWAVTATVVKARLEADRDYHLVLVDGGQTMIAEIPDPRCIPASNPWLPLVTTARHQLDTYHIGNKWVTINRQATITGVEFFDTPHGQDGVAPNAIELHPVLGLVWQ